eukprot:m.4262 g.4262  ORF g.4262 m.4262 type:complete len:200 (+) comp4446_c0_seq1:309-908(+)
MFSLLSGFWTFMRRKDEYYFLMIGLDGAGKTTLFETVKGEYNPRARRPAKICSTVGQNVTKVDTQGVRTVIWDLGGHADLQELWQNYYEECHAIIYVVDSCDRDRLWESKQVFDRVIVNPQLEGLPLLILCTKQEEQGAMCISEIKEVFNKSAHRLGLRDCKVLPVSAFDRRNVKDSIEWLTTRVIQNTEVRAPKQTES